MKKSVSASRAGFVGLSLAFVAAAGGGLLGGQSAGPPASQPGRQMPPLTFRVAINYVEVDAVVVDRKGEFVSTLQSGDFQVFEDGRPQAISNFGLVEIPVERPEAPLFVRRPIEPDVQSNVRPFNGRVYIIVLDPLHTVALHTPWVRTAAKMFIETAMGANDVAAVVTTQGSGAQEFTGNKRLLIAAVDKFVGNALNSATANKIEDYNMKRATPLANQTPIDTEEFHRAYNASATFDTIRQLSDLMAGIRGRRKAIVLFSEGVDYDISDVFNNQGASTVLRDSQEAIAAASRANVSIYTIDPRGLATLAGMGADTAAPPMDADPALGLNAQGMQNEMRVQQESLRTLSDETGGVASLNSNDFSSAFETIQKENSSYYVLGYYPVNERLDGRFRRIDVKVNRPGLAVRARKGYVAPRSRRAAAPEVETKEGTPLLLRETLASPLPISGLRLTAGAAVFKGTSPNASVRLVVQVDGRDFAFRENGGHADDTLELSVIAVDQKAGKVKGGARHSVAMQLKPQTQQLVRQSGVRVTSELDLPPGRYQLRIGAMSTNGQRTGSVYYDLDVPDFTSGPLTMSGLLLTSSLAAAMLTQAADRVDDVRKALPAPQTATREFRSGEELALVAEVYDNQGATPHRVDITTSLLADDGREIYRHQDERSSAELGGARGGYGYAARVPLRDLAPGLYVLRVEARSRLGKNVSVSREVQIRVTQ